MEVIYSGSEQDYDSGLWGLSPQEVQSDIRRHGGPGLAYKHANFSSYICHTVHRRQRHNVLHRSFDNVNFFHVKKRSNKITGCSFIKATS